MSSSTQSSSPFSSNTTSTNTTFAISTSTSTPHASTPTKETLPIWWTFICLPIIITVSSFVFFRLLQFAVRWYLFGKWTFPTFSYFKIRRFRRSHRSTKNMDSKSLQLVPPNKKWRISNEVVSLFHSGLSGLWALYLLANFEYIGDLVKYNKPQGEYLVFMTLGYLLHDFIDLLVNERSARIIELLFHHVVVIVAFLVNHISQQFLYIVVIGLLMEVNSIFLHTRSLMNLYRVSKDSTSFKIVALLNLATYVLFRLIVSVILISWLFYHYFVGEVVWYMLVINSLVIYSLFITNVVLFYRVLAADGLLGQQRSRASASGSGRDATVRSQPGDEENDDVPIENDEEEWENEDAENIESGDAEVKVLCQNNSANHHDAGVSAATGANITNHTNSDNFCVVNVTEH